MEFRSTKMIKMFSKAIVRKPCKNLYKGLTTSRLGLPDYQLALRQHAAYIEALEYCGLEVQVLDELEMFPDSVFVEDVALVTPNIAIITRPGALSRRGEVEFIQPVLKDYFHQVEVIQEPGLVDAGDILMVDTHYYIGISERTSLEGAEQLIEILVRHGLSGSTVTLSEMLHLKTGIAYLENNNILVVDELADHGSFQSFNQILVPQEEAYAANAIWMNGKILLPAGYPQTQSKIETAGYETILLDVSEFRKLDGGLSCLSLRF